MAADRCSRHPHIFPAAEMESPVTKIQEDGKLCPPRAGVLGEHGPLRFGLLGCADVAWRSMLPAMTADPDISVVAVASRNVARARRFADRFGCEAMTSYERLLARSDIDAVYVPLPAMLHAEWVEEALLTGKHVLAEKPLTHSHQATSRLFQLAHARGLHLLENFMFLRHTQHTAVASLLADGAIGELRGFESAFTIPPRPADDIRYQPDVGGGALLDIGVYPIRAAVSCAATGAAM
jgi:NDP-hexose-3-ketoreductase